MATKGLYFAIYYDVADKAFYRAAQTWELEVLQTCSPDTPFLYEQVSTSADFARAWRSIVTRSADTGLSVVQGQIFSHASKGSSDDGLEFKSTESEDGTINKSEMAALPRLNWAENGLLTLSGCNTGLAGQRGWTPAEVFAKSQRVKTIGQAGYAYFSRCHSTYVKIDGSSQVIYLWAYRRGKNSPLGFGARMPGVSFSP